MRIRFLMAGLLALLMLSWSAPALALSCIAPVTRYDEMSVVVKGTVTARPDKNRIVLQVDRYYKGQGPAIMQAEVQGTAAGDFTWINDPVVGSTYVMGFTQQGGRLVNGPCDLFIDMAMGTISPDLAQKMGQGVPPVSDSSPPESGDTPTEPPVSPAESRFPWGRVAIGASLTLALAGGSLLLLRRHSK